MRFLTGESVYLSWQFSIPGDLGHFGDDWTAIGRGISLVSINIIGACQWQCVLVFAAHPARHELGESSIWLETRPSSLNIPKAPNHRSDVLGTEERTSPGIMFGQKKTCLYC